ncbi:hypothetical protein [Mesorhizobium sp. M0898]
MQRLAHDKVVAVQFLASANQRTMPLEMFIGLREKLSPAIAPPPR